LIKEKFNKQYISIKLDNPLSGSTSATSSCCKFLLAIEIFNNKDGQE